MGMNIPRIEGLPRVLFPDALPAEIVWDWPELPAICRYPDDIHREMIRVKSAIRHYIEERPFISLTNLGVAQNLVYFHARLTPSVKNIHVTARIEA